MPPRARKTVCEAMLAHHDGHGDDDEVDKAVEEGPRARRVIEEGLGDRRVPDKQEARAEQGHCGGE